MSQGHYHDSCIPEQTHRGPEESSFCSHQDLEVLLQYLDLRLGPLHLLRQISPQYQAISGNDPLSRDLPAYHTKKVIGPDKTQEEKVAQKEANKVLKATAKKAAKLVEERSNAPFDPASLQPTVSDMEAMFSKGDLEKGATLGILKLDPDPKRVVLGSSNKNGSIMRRPIDYDITGAKISKMKRAYSGLVQFSHSSNRDH